MASTIAEIDARPPTSPELTDSDSDDEDGDIPDFSLYKDLDATSEDTCKQQPTIYQTTMTEFLDEGPGEFYRPLSTSDSLTEQRASRIRN